MSVVSVNVIKETQLSEQERKKIIQLLLKRSDYARSKLKYGVNGTTITTQDCELEWDCCYGTKLVMKKIDIYPNPCLRALGRQEGRTIQRWHRTGVLRSRRMLFM